MNTHEMIAAAAAIAGPMAAVAVSNSQWSAERATEIAQAAVHLAVELEKEARRAQTRPL